MASTDDKHFFIANYKGDDEYALRIVARSWILDLKSTLPFESETYYSNGSLDQETLPRYLLRQFVNNAFQKKEDGCVYNAKIITGFGE